MTRNAAFQIREPKPGEAGAIARIVEAAFKSKDEPRLIGELRTGGQMLLELVAADGGDILGHVAFSRVSASEGDGSLRMAALAPLAVRPDLQRRGIGTALVRAGLGALRKSGEDLVFVVGDTAYYPRFGFDTRLARTISCPWSGPAFMVRILRPVAGDRLPKAVAFASAFAEFEE